jgi:hypothetical protein
LLVPFTGDAIESPVTSMTRVNPATHKVVLRTGQEITIRLTGSVDGPGLALGE